MNTSRYLRPEEDNPLRSSLTMRLNPVFSYVFPVVKRHSHCIAGCGFDLACRQGMGCR